MTESDSSGAFVTDDLRTRIAAAVGDYHQRWGIKCECGADHAHAYGVADAVISELGLSLDCGILRDPYCVKCGIPHPDGKCGR